MSFLLTVTYRVSGDLQTFRDKAAEVAARIAVAQGLRWKLWGLNSDGSCISAYLFENPDAADAFANGPIISGLKSNPAVSGVTLVAAPVDATLSQITHAGFAT